MSTIREAFGSIATAIRSANGTTTSYTPAQMPDAIGSIGYGTLVYRSSFTIGDSVDLSYVANGTTYVYGMGYSMYSNSTSSPTRLYDTYKSYMSVRGTPIDSDYMQCIYIPTPLSYTSFYNNNYWGHAFIDYSSGYNCVFYMSLTNPRISEFENCRYEISRTPYTYINFDNNSSHTMVWKELACWSSSRYITQSGKSVLQVAHMSYRLSIHLTSSNKSFYFRIFEDVYAYGMTNALPKVYKWSFPITPVYLEIYTH